MFQLAQPDTADPEKPELRGGGHEVPTAAGSPALRGLLWP